MKIVLGALLVIVFCGALVSVSSAAHMTQIPPGVEPATPDPGPSRVPCDILLRYDDGSDDDPGSGPTLGWYGADMYQFLGVRFTPPGDGSYLVQSASWFSDFWVLPGNVDVTVTEWDNPSNTTTATVTVTGGGTWEVEFTDPICIPAGGEYSVMVCPQPGVFGVIGNDLADPDGRSYWVGQPNGCTPGNSAGADYMLWSCVTPCGPTPVEQMHWGQVKGLYR